MENEVTALGAESVKGCNNNHPAASYVDSRRKILNHLGKDISGDEMEDAVYMLGFDGEAYEH